MAQNTEEPRKSARKTPRPATTAAKKQVRSARKSPQLSTTPKKKKSSSRGETPFLDAALAEPSAPKAKRSASRSKNKGALPVGDNGHADLESARARVGEFSAAALGELAALESMIPNVLDRVARDLRDRTQELRLAIRRRLAASTATNEEEAAELAATIEKVALRLMQLRLEKDENTELLDRISRRLDKSTRRIGGK